MRKIVCLMLAMVVLMLALVGCGSRKSDKTVEGTMEELVDKILEKQPVEFMGGKISPDLEDTSEDGLWAINYNTGLKNGQQLSDIVVYEPTMGSQAFSLVLVRVKDAADTQKVAQEMSEGIDTRKWICVEADEKLTAGYGDVILLIMLSSQMDLQAQSFVDAFAAVCGGEPDFVIK